MFKDIVFISSSPQRKIELFVHTVRQLWMEKEDYKNNQIMIALNINPLMVGVIIDLKTVSFCKLPKANEYQ